MYSFKNDYSEGAHPAILQELLSGNEVQQKGYGEDTYSLEAKQILAGLIENLDARIHFVSGGTQANHLAIIAFLRPHEAAICVESGHIFVHEAGAIEATGHKVIAVSGVEGKINVESVQKVLQDHAMGPHMVKPRLVYISNSTEVGTIYKKEELLKLSEYCKSHNLLLYMDGARLGHALMASDNDLTLADISKLTDAFYIGATKNGGLLGEALVINTPSLGLDFDYIIKQRGAMLAKGRILGIQFRVLFKDGLYFKLAAHANAMAMKIQNAVLQKGYTTLTSSSTNQVFPIFPDELIENLSKSYEFFVWRKVTESTSAVRLITSWATKEEEVDRFISEL